MGCECRLANRWTTNPHLHFICRCLLGLGISQRCMVIARELEMDNINLQIAAGIVSTTIFTISNIPMLAKAAKTHDLKSYSFSNIALGNIGNLLHWAYICYLPFGPIWFLHGFYTISSIVMLFWYLHYEDRPMVSACLIRKIRCYLSNLYY